MPAVTIDAAIPQHMRSTAVELLARVFHVFEQYDVPATALGDWYDVFMAAPGDDVADFFAQATDYLRERELYPGEWTGEG
jgi:hypothetical protein